MSVPHHLASLLDDARLAFDPELTARVKPVTAVPVPKMAETVPSVSVRPFTAEELEAAWGEWSGYSPVLADVMLVLARTGLRWNEARAVTAADADAERITVRRSIHENGRARTYPTHRVRRVPVDARVRPIIQRLLAGRDADELLFATGLGEPLHRAPVLRRLNWPETGGGRRLQDLRHTAASLWLAGGAAPADVRTWLG